MSIRSTPWPAGVPCWADLTVPDVAAARAFYGPVLGWRFAYSGEEYGGYVIAQVGDAAAAGIGPLQQDGAPAAWTLYLASDDVDATAAAVTAAGGALLLPPGDVGPMGRLAIAADPAGAVFGIWQHGVHIGAGVVNEPGGLSWEDLRSTDPASAQAFYAGVFGWEFRALEAAGPDYATFSAPGDDAPMGGLGGMMGAPEGTPSHWLVYFGVADADAAAAAAEANGGSVLAPPFDTPFGRMGVLRDPAGAAFWIAQTDQASMPDRGDRPPL
jgi:predicted enzyme related to lactoylglutathione lyase